MPRASGRRATRVTRAAVLVAVLAGMSACGSDEDSSEPTLGMRAGGGLFNGERFEATEDWLGLEVPYTVQFTGRQSQRDMNGSAFGLLAADGAGLPRFADRLTLSITVPLGFGRTNANTREGRDQIASTLNAVAAGDYDQPYRRVARRLIEGGYADAIIRLGHEFNGSWAPWSSRTNEAEFIAAWRHVHDVFAEESSDFEFDWTAMRPSWEEWGEQAYPGDDYVDIVGLDVYWRVQTGGEAWTTDAWERDYLSVMRDHLAFAIAHGKQVSYPEWGLTGADTARFIEAMHEWIAALPTSGPGGLRYHAYFDSGEFRLEDRPHAAVAFRELFGAD